MSLPQMPDLFGRLPASLFTPLTGTHASLTWAVLARLYQHEFEREPFSIVKPTAIEIAERVVDESPLWRERRDDLLAGLADEAGVEALAPADAADEEAEQLRALSRRIVDRLERTGWFHFEYRSSLGLVLNFYPYAARILETLVRVARDEQPVLQGYAHSIASLLKAESFAARPGVALSEAKRHTLELVRELKILNRNIFAFTQRMLDEVTTAAGVLEESVDRYRQAVQDNYHRLKTVENLYKWRGNILLRLDEIERDTMSLDAAARWYAEQHTKDHLSALVQVRADLHLMRMQFETMPQITDDIDARNARFSGVALRRLMYFLHQGSRVEAQLQYITDQLARDASPDIALDVYRCELLDDGFLYNPPRRRPRVVAQPLARPARPDAQALRRDVARLVRRPFGRAAIQAYVEELLARHPRVRLEELPLETDEEYLRLIFVVVYGLDGASSFVFRRADTAGGALARKGSYGFPDGHIERAARRRG